jgi:hypothetical protein
MSQKTLEKPILFLILSLMAKLLTYIEVFVLLLAVATGGWGCVSSESSDKELLDTLDRELVQGGQYVDERLSRIGLLEGMRERLDVSDEQLFQINILLYDEYSSFQFDGAQQCLVDNLSLAERLGNKARATDASIRLGMLYTTAGMYLEAREVLDPLDTLAMSPSQKVGYMNTQQRFYREFREYSVHPEMVAEAIRLQQYYRTRLFELYDKGSQEWLALAVESAMGAEDMARADSLNAILLASHSTSSHNYAMYAYNQALIEYSLGRGNFRDWYVRSAIADIRSATKDNASLASLARQLFLDGENVDRAFKYVKASMDDAIFYNGKLRPWQIAQFMPVIEQSYLQQAEVARRTQWILIGVLLLFAGYAFVMFRRERRFASQIGAKNDRIEQINTDLQRKNDELQRLNKNVLEANAVKEEYIGLLLAMCSEYIEKMLKMQRKISRRFADGDVKSLEKELSASKLMDAEMRDFYNMFDSAFLRLYPDFIEEFNSLLQDDQRIVPPTGEMLDTELRIFALIRLGIDDSSKIATLLRYSPNTIYNYRAKVKNKAKGPRDEFEDKILTIGSFKSSL